jgi:SAM-dependent methyltransferase
MKLSELVTFKNELDRLSAVSAQKTADNEINKITHLVGSFALTVPQSEQFEQARSNIIEKFIEFEDQLNELKLSIKKQIEDAERPWFAESYRLYEKEMINETVEYILNRRAVIGDSTKEFYKNRISRYTNWKYPAMFIRPGLEDYVNGMVACDPLYLVDEQYDLLTPIMSQHNELYQQRLRPYVINERQDGEILNRLPNDQFGLIVVYNFFNFRPLEVIRQYLTELYEKLRTGGILVMTINDCDRDKGVILVEQHFACYTPGNMIIDLAKSIGFEVEFVWNDDGPATWIELRRPGELTSLRGGQTLAKIVAK